MYMTIFLKQWHCILQGSFVCLDWHLRRDCKPSLLLQSLTRAALCVTLLPHTVLLLYPTVL